MSVPALPALPENHLIVLPKTIGPKMVRRVVAWVEEMYNTRKRYPSDSEFLNRFDFSKLNPEPIEGLRQLQKNKLYKLALDNRGIITTPVAYLTPKQIDTIATLSNLSDQRSRVAKLARIGVTVEQYNGWMKNSHFRQQMENAIDESVDTYHPDAAVALARNIEAGNQRALEFYYNITGRAETPEQLEVKQTLNLLVEVLQRTLDPDTFSFIAKEFEAVLKLQKGQH